VNAVHKELLSHTPLLALPIFAMFVFLAVFLCVCVVTLTRRRRAYAEVANLALKDESHE
jgi:cbb3-type cytochrome oxidase subunit 3